MPVRVVTDSVSDIPPEVASKLGITVVPLNVVLGNVIYRDGVDLTTDEFYRKLEQSQILPTHRPSALSLRAVAKQSLSFLPHPFIPPALNIYSHPAALVSSLA